jgi:two-component system CheB/CheR fusion protein
LSKKKRELIEQSLAVPAEAEAPSQPAAATFPVVGVGASAGGLSAFEAFFSGMPADGNPGMAFVLVQHLAPDHKSILSDLVKRYTRMQVFDVEDGMRVEPNCTYVIPPNRDMAFLNGTLQLLEPSSPRGMRLPIDFFFRSLAHDQREKAICIVLSGTGSDGTLGARAVKGEGGMVMAQIPESTEYDGMPRSAIATGLVDFVLPPAEMPAQLISYVTHAFGKTAIPATAHAPHAEGSLKRIFILLRAQTGHDFSHYKVNTIARRVERRMAINQVERLDEYVRYLQHNAPELDLLFRDLLIGVTSFFRDPVAFDALKELGIPALLAGKSPGATIRVWVPGCSTGEEAYSIAILLHEQSEAMRQSFKLQVFATDIDSQAIERARSGVYPASIAADVPPEYLTRYFVQEPDGSAFRVHKGIRDSLIFSEQDVIKDPPFSRLDLISCRNLLIYLDGELQKKLLPMFHYAVRPGGFLFLGTSETVGEFSELFSAIDRQAKLFLRRPDVSGARRTGGGWPAGISDAVAVRHPGKTTAESKISLREQTERALLLEFAPVAALVDEHGTILYVHGRTGLFLEPPPGDATLSILKMGREGLRQRLATALHRAVLHGEAVTESRVHVKTNGSYTTIDLSVRPLRVGSVEVGTRAFLITFQEVQPAEEGAENFPGPTDTSADNDAHITALRHELRAKQEYLQTTIEELETSNEELKSSNEEMQSINEELQSTNEELETSKEELQSVNEELATVNAELQQKVSDLSRANNDMNNLLAGTGIGTIFVDHQLRILRFTPVVTQVINLILSDVGRPVGHIVSNLVGYDRLVEDIEEVLDTLVPKEAEAQTVSGAWYTLRIRPYRTLENVIEGAVITFVDITEQKLAREAAHESSGRPAN